MTVSADNRTRNRLPSAMLVTVAASLAVLAAVHPLPGVGGLRSLCQILLLTCSLGLLWRNRRVIKAPAVSTSGVLLGVLSLWLLYQSGFIAPAPQQSIKLLFSEWGKTVLLLVMGIWLATTLQTGKGGKTWLITATFAGFFGHTLMTLAFQVWYVLKIGYWNPGESLLGNYGYVAPLVDYALALLLADVATRICFVRRMLPLSNWMVALALALNLLAMVALTAKASLVMTVLLLTTLGVVLIRNIPRHRQKMSRLVMAALLLVIAFTTSFHQRWNGADRSISAGLDTAGNLAWLDPSIPLPPDIDGSFYLRVAWGKIGLEGIAAHPLGLGYGADAFGRYVAETYGKTSLISSHSGWINFTLSNGIPGILLFLALAGLAFAKGVQAFRNGSGEGLALAFLILNYIGRCAFDDQLSASRLAGFSLVVGVFWGLMQASAMRSPQTRSTDAAS